MSPRPEAMGKVEEGRPRSHSEEESKTVLCKN